MTDSVPRREHGNAWLACAWYRLSARAGKSGVCAAAGPETRLWRPDHQRAGEDCRRSGSGRSQEEQLADGDLRRGTRGRPRLLREDGWVQLASVEISQGKARTAVRFRVPSKVFADQYAAGNMVFTTFPEKPVASEGGIPIVVNDRIIGAIGVSGGTGQQDGAAANAGATAVK